MNNMMSEQQSKTPQASQKTVVVTCALTGVLTNPKQHPVPVTAKEMASEAKAAYDAGASIMHVHFRRQEAGLGHLPSWEPDVAAEIVDAIRQACPRVVINQSTGVVGDDFAGPESPFSVMRRIKPEIAACNAGTLNYLKTRQDGSWAWPPMIFDNPVEKVAAFLQVMQEVGALPEFECFDLGILRSVSLYVENGMLRGFAKEKNGETYIPIDVNFVMGVASGMPADPDLVDFLCKYAPKNCTWQATVIGRDEVWPVHRRVARLGGNLRTGLEDTFYLPNGQKATGNGALVEALVKIAQEEGRSIASPDEARALLHL